MNDKSLNFTKHLINIRRNEIYILSSLFGKEKLKEGIKILEIGCGNTFSAAFFPKTELVVCTDLPEADAIHCKPILNEVRLASNELRLQKIKFIACSGLELPFKDNAFDIVFSQYVLEHIKNQDNAIEEVKRVLKNGGLVISLVPNFVERLYEFPRYYLYLLKRLNSLLWSRLRLNNNESITRKISDSQQQKVNLSNFFYYYPHFPFIEPHGEYKNAIQEFIRHLPFNWIKLFKRHDLDIVEVFSTNFLPWNFLEVISYRLTDSLYRMSMYFTLKAGKAKIIKYFGYSLCIIASKKDKYAE